MVRARSDFVVLGSSDGLLGLFVFLGGLGFRVRDLGLGVQGLGFLGLLEVSRE